MKDLTPSNIVEQYPLSTVTVDASGVIQTWNMAAESLTGWYAEDVLGKPWVSLFPKSAAEWSEFIQPALNGESVVGQIKGMSARSGQHLLCRWWLSPLITDENERRGCAIVFERMASHDTGVIAGPSFVLSLIEAMPFMLYLFSLDENAFVFVNEHATSILGYTPSELLQVDSWHSNYIHPDDSEVIERNLHEFQDAEDGDIIENEYRVRHASGEWRWLHTRELVFNRDKDGRPVLAIGTAEDITLRKSQQADVKRSEERYRSLFQRSPIALWEADMSALKQHLDALSAEGIEDFRTYFDRRTDEVFKCAGLIKILSVNHATLVLYEAHTEDELRDGLHAIYREDSLPGFKEELIAFAEKKYEFDGEIVNYTLRSHRRALIRVRVAVPKPYRQNFKRVYAASVDLTELKNTAANLAETNERLEHTLHELRETQDAVIQQERLSALGMLASGIAHDFNNALTTVLGFSELLLNRPESLDDRDKTLRYLKLIHSEALDAASVVSRLRRFYVGTDAKGDFEAVLLNELVEDVVELTRPQWKERAHARGVTISLETDLSPMSPLQCCPSEVRELLTNFVLNAIDAMPKGGTITLRTYKASETDGSSTVLEVSDTGVGMDDKTQARCMDPFYSTKGERGTGLGLSVAYGIIERHNATIEVDSEIGRGTTFRMKFPFHAQDLPPQEPEQHEVPSSAKGLNILFAEDEELIREVLSNYLKQDGHDVTLANDGAAGAAEFRRSKFDLVITDWAMPGLSGEELSNQVKEISPRTPVIMVTGFGDIAVASGQRPKNVDAIISKPVQLAELREVIARLV